MSNTAVALLIGGTVVTVGGVVAFLAIRKKKQEEAPVVAMGASAGAPAVAAPARELSTGEALAIIGGKALQEGIKYGIMGPSAYAASIAGRSQKQA